MEKFLPEGSLINTAFNKRMVESLSSIRRAFENEIILEGVCVLCDREHNLHVKVGEFDGIIPRIEAAYGIETGETRDVAIISRVSKPVAFIILGITDTENGTRLVLSRRKVQERFKEECQKYLLPGDVLSATITHLESFGAFADIGVGVNALLPVDSISVSRIPHPSARFHNGQSIKCIVRTNENGKITLTHKELLGTWEENAKKIIPGETVPGIIRSIEKYGIFVELTPNLSGLAEYVEGVKPGQMASVFVKSVCPEKMKVKLIIIDNFEVDKINYNENTMPIEYFINDASHIEYFRYSPMTATKLIESRF